YAGAGWRAAGPRALGLPEPWEGARGFGGGVLATDLGPGEGSLVEEGARPAALGEQDGGGPPRRPRSHHDHVHRRHRLVRTAHCRMKATWWTTRTSKSPAFSHSAVTSRGV